MILDTNFLSDLIDGEQEAWEKAKEIHGENNSNSITPIVLFELYFGAKYDENDELVRMVNNILTMYNIEGMDIDAAKEGATLLADADLQEGGESGVETEDAMIAGSAACNNHTVLTDNVLDFNKLGVDVENFK
mgnify:CR=1 FL=1